MSKICKRLLNQTEFECLHFGGSVEVIHHLALDELFEIQLVLKTTKICCTCGQMNETKKNSLICQNTILTISKSQAHLTVS